MAEMEKAFLEEKVVGAGGTPLGVVEARVAERLKMNPEAVKSTVRRHKKDYPLLSTKEDYHEGLSSVHKDVLPHSYFRRR